MCLGNFECVVLFFQYGVQWYLYLIVFYKSVNVVVDFIFGGIVYNFGVVDDFNFWCFGIYQKYGYVFMRGIVGVGYCYYDQKFGVVGIG